MTFIQKMIWGQSIVEQRTPPSLAANCASLRAGVRRQIRPNAASVGLAAYASRNKQDFQDPGNGLEIRSVSRGVRGNGRDLYVRHRGAAPQGHKADPFQDFSGGR